MVIADNLRAAEARGTVGINERFGGNLEMGLRGGMSVSSCHGISDPSIAAEQDAAAFVRVRGARVSTDLIQRFSCHFNVHRAWP